jgi:hypothetical protein
MNINSLVEEWPPAQSYKCLQESRYPALSSAAHNQRHIHSEWQRHFQGLNQGQSASILERATRTPKFMDLTKRTCQIHKW